ncbi:MAG: hypothetical protein ACRCX2_35925 [Paraclostridium sp.]
MRVDKRINVSFKNNDLDNELYEFIKKEGGIIGVSSYIKHVLIKDMEIKKNNENKK